MAGYPGGGRFLSSGESGYTSYPGDLLGSSYGQRCLGVVDVILERVEAYDSGYDPRDLALGAFL
jgi:hypothetical protein